MPLCAFVLAGLAPAAAQGTHWSYLPVVRPALPETQDSGWCRSGIDRLVLEVMHEHGLQPSPAADPATWLRRVSLDLTGLPPTPAELDAFLAGAGPDARERAVDRLLQGSAYAERWTQWWLDLARYADSQGYEKDDLRRSMWRYRDWVIDAFARDMPFDRFTIEQIAGDLLPGATPEQQLATAFHRQTMTNTEGGTDDEEFRTAAVIDRVDTTMSVWMGFTLGCAQCHDHKYDPFSQKEFYELYAFFDQTEDNDQPDDAPVLRVPTEEQAAAMKVLDLELDELRGRMHAEDAAVMAWAEPRREVLAAFAAAQPKRSPWHVLGPVAAGDLHAAHATAFAPEREGVRLDAEQEGQRWRTEYDYKDGQVHTWKGDNSAFYLHRTYHAEAAAIAVLALGSDDAIKVWWNGAEVLAKEVARPAAPDQEMVSVALRAGDNELLLKVSNGGGPGGFYFDLRATDLGAPVEKVLALAPDARDAAAMDVLRREYLARAPEYAAVRQRIAQAEAELETHRGPLVPILRELPEDKRRTTRIHLRGSFLSPGDVVQPGTPRVWPPLPADAPRNRLGLARWLVARDNPLTARVLVNRLWNELFGRGLVTTLEDFGSQGEPPSHGALLDWLAAELMDGGWSMRHLLRTIVLSATYAQSSALAPELREQDPENRWLARGPAFRLSAEMLRDQALAVSGSLTATVGGPSVMPPQPDGIWMQIYSGERWQTATGPDRHRRGLYTFWRRTSPHPAMLLFDAQSREACVLRRQRTNTPLQALVLWNDPEFHEAALALAARTLLADCAGDDAERIRRLWRRCLLRLPTDTEQSRVLSLLQEERARFAGDPDSARATVGAGADEAPAELAAWSVLASVVMNLDEFVTKR
ncbi:MAG TPA: DUF1549 and DUF1553 domain-containing protein [Planctomycetota bacterium]|nr:DUF1549 and DUF1553 domain-containing protein [Planctomycetota bacterium]